MSCRFDKTIIHNLHKFGVSKTDLIAADKRAAEVAGGRAGGAGAQGGRNYSRLEVGTQN